MTRQWVINASPLIALAKISQLSLLMQMCGEMLNTDLAGVPQNLEVRTLAYCSEIFYFVDGELKTTGVCD